MSLAVWKFGPFNPSFFGSHPFPAGARLLHADVQRGDIHVWALVDPSADTEARILHVAATGQELPADVAWKHVGTVLEDGLLVWHVFDGGPAA